MSAEDATAVEDGGTAPTGTGQSELTRRVTRGRTPTGRFAQELAAANDHALIRMRVRAERAEATLADLRRDAARAILGLRRQVEFWRLVADGIDRTEAAVRAGLAESVDLASTGSNTVDGIVDLADSAGIAGNDGMPKRAEQAAVASSADSAETCALAGHYGSAGATRLAPITGKSGKGDLAGRGS